MKDYILFHRLLLVKHVLILQIIDWHSKTDTDNNFEQYNTRRKYLTLDTSVKSR